MRNKSILIRIYPISDCAEGMWGAECANECDCGFNVQECSPVDGCTVCKSGWEGYNCVTDVNECANDSDNECDTSTTRCENTDGSYSCICYAGTQSVDGICTGKSSQHDPFLHTS